MTAQSRAELTEGHSIEPIYRAVERIIREQHPGGGTLLDIGCGCGNLRPYVHQQFAAYAGADVLHYEKFPADAAFHKVNLDTGRVELPDEVAEVVASLETIEHIENPRAMMREIVRLTKPGGLVIVTTPNQLSLLSKLTLLVKNRFNAFQDGTGNAYPTHITALLEIDLVRMANECGLQKVQVAYTDSGRIPGISRSWPSSFRGRAFSDNVLLYGRKPAR